MNPTLHICPIAPMSHIPPIGGIARAVRFSAALRVVAAVVVAVLLLAGAGVDARAAAVVATSMPGGAPGAPGTQFTVLVRVSQNDTGQMPIAYSFRIKYRSTAVELLSAAEVELGPPTIGAVQGTPPNVFQDIVTLGDFNNANPVPDCFILTFRVLSGAVGFYTIEIADPSTGTPLVAKDFGNIPHTFDNSETTNLGEPVPPKPNPTLDYTFVDSAEDWRFVAAPPFASPVATRLPDGGGTLALGAVNNTACFGYWESPVIDLAPADSIYTVDYFIRSVAADPTKTPQIRLRSSSTNLQQSRFMTLESRADGLASPVAGGTTYTLLLSPGIAAEQVRLEFELLNFDSLDDPAGELHLDSIHVTRRNVADIAGRIPVRFLTFDSGSDGWSARSTSAFSAPLFGTSGGGVFIQGNGRADAFGYWTSGELPGGVPVIPGAAAADSPRPLYIATFTVESDVAIGNRSRIPQFRMRLNESQGRAAAYMAIESRGDATLSPISGMPRQYVVYFLPPTTLSERPLIASFDFLNFDATDLATASLRLNEFKLEVAPYPW